MRWVATALLHNCSTICWLFWRRPRLGFGAIAVDEVGLGGCVTGHRDESLLAVSDVGADLEAEVSR